MTWNFVIKDSNALQICKGREVVCEARSAYSAHRLAKLLNLGLQVEREAAAKRKAIMVRCLTISCQAKNSAKRKRCYSCGAVLPKIDSHD